MNANLHSPMPIWNNIQKKALPVCSHNVFVDHCIKENRQILGMDDLPLLSARDKKPWILFKLYSQISENNMIVQIFERYCRRQRDINATFDKQILMC